MANKVGTKTGQKTSAGKEVYKTPEGESVSEKSVTIKFGDNAYVNAPSIHNGKRYTEDEIKEMLLEGTIKPTSRHDTLEEAIKAAKTRSDNLLKDGGMAKRMTEQMELFEEGGFMDEGNTVDPVSGNEVPVGSTQEEVRDDIPAQLSEGEFVLPADVVRYHGLDKIMALRDEAKAGLARMEAMGQMGNSDEAIIPDDVPFDIDDLDIEDEEEQGELNFAVGGAVPMPGFTGIGGYQPAATPTTGFAPAPTVAAPVQAASAQPMQAGTFQPAGTQFTPTTVSGVMPTFQETIGFGVPNVDYELVDYINDAGQIIKLKKSKSTGELLEPVPAGFRPVGDGTTTPTTEPVQVETAQTGGGEGRDDTTTQTTTTGTLKDLGLGSFSLKGILGNTKSKAYNEAVTSLGLNQLGSLSPFGAIGSLVLGEVSPNTKAVMMNQSRLNAANILGVKDIDTASVEQLDTIGNIMKTANNFALKDNSLYNSIKTGTPAGVSKDRVDRAVATISGSLAEAVQKGIINNEDLAGIASLERDSKTGAYKGSSGKTVTERATVVGPDGKTTTKNISIDKSVMDYVNAMLGTDDQMTPTEKTNARASALESAARQDVREAAKTSAVRQATPTATRDDRIAQTANALMARGMTATDALNAASRAETTGRIDADTASAFGRTPTATKASLSSRDRDSGRDEDSGPTGVGVGRGEDSPSAARDASRATGVSVGRGEDSPTAARDAPKSRSSSSSGGGGGGDKIVCTAMNNAYGFGSFRQTVWLQHSKNMDPAYQKGYHRIFKPLIKFAYKDKTWYNMFVRSMLEGIARRRTADIWMQKHGKRHLRGAIERAILEPLCYIVGKIK